MAALNAAQFSNPNTIALQKLARASNAVLRGQPVEAEDREFIADALDECYMRERARQMARRPSASSAEFADLLQRRSRISLRRAAAVAAWGCKPATVLRALKRLMSNRSKRK